MKLLDYSELDFEPVGGLNAIASDGNYDYESIMHYPNNEKFPVMRALKDPKFSNRMGFFFTHGTFQDPFSEEDKKKLRFYCSAPKGSLTN